MLKAVCTKAFQFRGSMMRSGAIVDITESEAKDPWVASHCRIEKPGAMKGENRKKRKETPASIAKDRAVDLDENEIKARLRKLGVVYEKTATPAELEALYENARELVAGSPLEENRPTDLGI